jgi:hypothetical protein
MPLGCSAARPLGCAVREWGRGGREVGGGGEGRSDARTYTGGAADTTRNRERRSEAASAGWGALEQLVGQGHEATRSRGRRRQRRLKWKFDGPNAEAPLRRPRGL